MTHRLELGVFVVEGLHELVDGGGGVAHFHQHLDRLLLLLGFSNRNIEIHHLAKKTPLQSMQEKETLEEDVSMSSNWLKRAKSFRMYELFYDFTCDNKTDQR